jgi:transposase
MMAERWKQDDERRRQYMADTTGLERDKVAVQAGLTLHYSTRPVEGHIHRLKLLKRQAYGRASPAYLQQRFLSGANMPVVE